MRILADLYAALVLLIAFVGGLGALLLFGQQPWPALALAGGVLALTGLSAVALEIRRLLSEINAKLDPHQPEPEPVSRASEPVAASSIRALRRAGQDRARPGGVSNNEK